MAKNFQAIMADARKEVPEVSAQQVNELLKNNGKSPILLDVRESDEWRQGHGRSSQASRYPARRMGVESGIRPRAGAYAVQDLHRSVGDVGASRHAVSIEGPQRRRPQRFT